MSNWSKDVIRRQRDLNPGGLDVEFKGTAPSPPSHRKLLEGKGHDASVFTQQPRKQLRVLHQEVLKLGARIL